MAATIQETIRRLRYSADTRGIKDARIEIVRLDAAQSKAASTTKKAASETDKLTSGIARLEARVDRETRLQRQLTRDTELLGRAYRDGAIDLTRFNRLTELATAHNAKLAASANATTAAMKRQSGAMAGMGGMIGGFAAFFAADRLISVVDASTRITNTLKVAGLEGEALTAVYDKLYASALRNAAPMESLVELYGRASQVQKELGVSTDEMLKFTDRVAVALRVSGRSASESSGALLQLSQALGAGTVRAEEFNSILEGALPIAQAAAAGLDEAGGSVAQLRQLVVNGEVSSKKFFEAFLAGSAILEGKVAGAQTTVSQGFSRLNTVMTDAVGQFDKATGLSSALGSAILELSYMIEDLGDAFERNEPGIVKFFGTLHAGLTWIQGEAQRIREAIGLEDFFEGTSLIEGRVGFASRQGMSQAAMDDTFKLVERSREVTVLAKALADKVAQANPIQTVSLNEANAELATTEEKLIAIGKLNQGLAGTTMAKTPAIIDAFKVGFQDVDKAAKAAEGSIRNIVDIPLPRLRPEIDNATDGMLNLADAAAGFAEGFVDAVKSGDEVANALAAALASVVPCGSDGEAVHHSTNEENPDVLGHHSLAA